MSRALRLLVADRWYHVAAHGNERRACFRGDGGWWEMTACGGWSAMTPAALGAAAGGMRYGVVAAAVRNLEARLPRDRRLGAAWKKVVDDLST